jgi:hypothetical protein
MRAVCRSVGSDFYIDLKRSFLNRCLTGIALLLVGATSSQAPVRKAFMYLGAVRSKSANGGSRP